MIIPKSFITFIPGMFSITFSLFKITLMFNDIKLFSFVTDDEA